MSTDTQPPGATATGYDVGYGKPPKHTRWVKGQSGNPYGKKIGDKSFKKLFQKVAAQKVSMPNGHGQLKAMSLQQAVIAAAFHHAAKGNPKMSVLAAKLMEKLLPTPIEKPEHEVGQIVKHGNRVCLTAWISDEHLKEIEKLATLKPSWEMFEVPDEEPGADL